MGPNRQRRPAVVRGRGRGRGGATNVRPAAPAPSMISAKGRDLIIDVLHHAASNGAVPVPEKHFDASGSRVVFQRNTPLTPSEILQRLFEGIGFPRDLVTQYLTDLSASIPSFADVGELLAEDSPCQMFLVRCCFELFSCMTWFARGEEANDSPVEEATAEEGDEMLDEEIQLIQQLFSDSVIGTRNFSDDASEARQLYLLFQTADTDAVLVVIEFPDFYPAEPPCVFLQPIKGPVSGSDLPRLGLFASCTQTLPAADRRQILDSAVQAICSFRGTGCLAALASAIGGAVSCVSRKETQSSSPTSAAPASPAGASTEKELAAKQRKAFVESLGKGGVSASGGGEGDGEGEEDKFFQYTMPAVAELKTIDAHTQDKAAPRREFLRRDAALDETLRDGWSVLRKSGSLAKTREALPAFLVRESLRHALSQSNVVVIGGETGSGKTTQIPQYLLEFMYEEGLGSSANIVCTQPRRLAATSVALRVAEERDEAVGGTVGYSIRLENCVSKKTQLTYCTTGIILRRLQTDKFLGRVSHIVVDEIHERGVDTDFLLILLRELVAKRSDLKVILMSATMDSELFARYFGGAPILSIQGRTFPVKVLHLENIIPEVKYVVEEGTFYENPSSRSGEGRRRNTRRKGLELDLDDAQEDLDTDRVQRELASQVSASPATLDVLSRMNFDVIHYELIEKIVLYIDTTLRVEGAVLVFLPGMAEIQSCMEQLLSNPHLCRVCVFFNLHSSLGNSEQQGVFQRAPRGKRKVILGTNIMETSITIDDAVFVIDTGKAKENRYNARKSLSELVTVSISKANCRQRQGRAGRVREGFCFRLFTEAQYESFEDHQLCEMHRVPLESLILQIYALHLGDEVEYLQKALSPPEEKAIHSSVKVLTTLGALTAQKRLTSLGQHLANLPLDVRVGKMIIHGALLQCLDPVLTIAACLAVRSPFIASMDFRTEVEGVRRAFAGEHPSDQLVSWYAYNRWSSALVEKGPAAARRVSQDCYLSQAALSQIQSTKRQYERYLCEAGFLENVGNHRVHASKFIFPPHVTLDNKAYESGGRGFNTNSGNRKCILACLVAGLYPNVARQQKPKAGAAAHRRGLRLNTFDGSECFVHPSSVLSKETTLASSLLVYVDKIKTSQTFLREVSTVSQLHVVLFGGGELEYLPKYQELCVDEMIAFKCAEGDAGILTHLKQQLDSALTQKINEPTRSWESVSSNVVRAIVQLLQGEESKHLTIVDRRAPRAPLTELLVPEDISTAGSPSLVVDKAAKGRSCFHCGEYGHLSRNCPHAAQRNGPSVRCFVCGQWHFPMQCGFLRPMKDGPKPV